MNKILKYEISILQMRAALESSHARGEFKDLAHDLRYRVAAQERSAILYKMARILMNIEET